MDASSSSLVRAASDLPTHTQTHRQRASRRPPHPRFGCLQCHSHKSHGEFSIRFAFMCGGRPTSRTVCNAHPPNRFYCRPVTCHKFDSFCVCVCVRVFVYVCVHFLCSLFERHVSSTLLNGTRCVLASIRKLNNKQQFHKL